MQWSPRPAETAAARGGRPRARPRARRPGRPGPGAGRRGRAAAARRSPSATSSAGPRLTAGPDGVDVRTWRRGRHLPWVGPAGAGAGEPPARGAQPHAGARHRGRARTTTASSSCWPPRPGRRPRGGRPGAARPSTPVGLEVPGDDRRRAEDQHEQDDAEHRQRRRSAAAAGAGSATRIAGGGGARDQAAEVPEQGDAGQEADDTLIASRVSRPRRSCRRTIISTPRAPSRP